MDPEKNRVQNKKVDPNKIWLKQKLTQGIKILIRDKSQITKLNKEQKDVKVKQCKTKNGLKINNKNGSRTKTIILRVFFNKLAVLEFVNDDMNAELQLFTVKSSFATLFHSG